MAEVVYIAVQSVDVGSIQAVVVVAADENLVGVWQVAKPVHKINGFLFAAVHREVARVDNNVRLGQLLKPVMTTVGIGEVEDGHCMFVSVLFIV